MHQAAYNSPSLPFVQAVHLHTLSPHRFGFNTANGHLCLVSLLLMTQVPLIGFIGRLDYQKGADLVLGAAPWLLNQDVQIVCLGTGDKHLEVMLMFLITLLHQQSQ